MKGMETNRNTKDTTIMKKEKEEGDSKETGTIREVGSRE